MRRKSIRKKSIHKNVTLKKGNKTRSSINSQLKKKTFKKNDYYSGDGMLTTVWGPSMWHYLHTMSFNYPIHPSADDKKHYRDFIISLQHVLPCKSLRHARAVEKEGHIFLDKQLERAMVKWNPITLEKAPNRGWDWWITQHTTTHYNYLELIELMRNRQINWTPSFSTHRKKIIRLKRG